MQIVYFVALNSLGHLAFVGVRMTTVLFALQLGASPFTIGIVMALFAALPMLLSVYAGRLIDRSGPRRPLLAAFAALAVGVLLPFALPGVTTLYVASTLCGVGFMFIHIGMNSVFGAHGSPESRPMNFAWLALGFSISGSLGPLVAGFAIEHLGHRAAFLALAGFPAIALCLLAFRRKELPQPERTPGNAERFLLDLLRVPGLRRIFLASGLMAMGWDLYSFLMPLYCARLGLSASTIGIVMATFAIATFVVRLVMPMVIRRVRQWVVIATSMGVAGTAYLLFPFADRPTLLMMLACLLGLGLGCAQPVIMSILYEAAPPGRQSEAVGVRTTMINASQTLIPLTSGALTVAVGLQPVFWVLALGLLAGAWFARQQVKSADK
jgi:MFS family permease